MNDYHLPTPTTPAGRAIYERSVELIGDRWAHVNAEEVRIMVVKAEREAVQAALTVERIAEALQIGWPGSKARRQAYYRALAAALRVALLAPSEQATG